MRPTLGDVLHVNKRIRKIPRETKITVLARLVRATRRKFAVDWGLPGSVMESKASYNTMVLGVVSWLIDLRAKLSNECSPYGTALQDRYSDGYLIKV